MKTIITYSMQGDEICPYCKAGKLMGSSLGRVYICGSYYRKPISVGDVGKYIIKCGKKPLTKEHRFDME